MGTVTPPLKPEGLRRTALRWLHLACAGAIAFALLRNGTLSMGFVLAGGRARGLGVALVVLPVVLPFALSFAISKRVVPTRSSYTRIYAAVLVIATVVGTWDIALTSSVRSVFLAAVGLALVLAGAGLIINTYDRRNPDG